MLSTMLYITLLANKYKAKDGGSTNAKGRRAFDRRAERRGRRRDGLSILRPSTCNGIRKLGLRGKDSVSVVKEKDSSTC